MAERLPSVWLTGQQQSRAQRRGRYLPESMAHPGKMLPAIAARAIATYTEPGDLVCDPMCGIWSTPTSRCRVIPRSSSSARP